MLMSEIRCPACDTPAVKVHTTYTVQAGETRRLYYCGDCHCYFSETHGTALAGLRTPLSRISQILDALNDGLVQDQKTYSGMVGATLAVDQGRRKADPYRGNPAYPICVCIRQLRWSERAQAQQLHH